MKCPNCGADIPANSFRCLRCGKPATVAVTAKKQIEKPPQNQIGSNDKIKAITDNQSRKVDYREIHKRMSFEYSHTFIDLEAKILDGINQMCESFTEQKINIGDFLSKVADFIYKNFGISDVSIGLRDANDGLYRYKAFAGFRESTIAFRKTLAYKKEDFYGAPPYKCYQISKYSRLYLVEDSPYDEAEREAYNWPSLISVKRTSLTKALEGDYFNIHLIGPGDDMFGWIDLSGTKQRTFPDIKVIKWVELIGRIVTATLLLHKLGIETK
jgi:hypothetical protein